LLRREEHPPRNDMYEVHLFSLTHYHHRDKVLPYTDTSSSLWKYNHRLMGKSP
jgi:hypothetical protein